ncbi:MAG: hypothetical protein FWG90_03620 [Oscillospiraceae bacterium]|nr:hypothetical protein [Oscillospiraceae bacterium]
MGKRKLTDEQIKKAYRAWCGGWSLVRLAEHFNVSENTIKRRFKELNYKKTILPFEKF